MFFYYLLAAHFVGDFVLQSNGIAEKKTKEIKWVFLHSLIVSGAMLFVALPTGIYGRALVAVAGISHFVIDIIKMKWKMKSPAAKGLYFIGDQFMHIWILWMVSRLYQGNYPDILETNTVFILVTLLFAVYFSSICIQFIMKIMFPAGEGGFYNRNEKQLGNVNRFVLYCAMLLSYEWNMLFLLAIVIWLVAVQSYYVARNLKEWMPYRYFLVKLMLDMVFTLSSGVIFLLLKA